MNSLSSAILSQNSWAIEGLLFLRQREMVVGARALPVIDKTKASEAVLERLEELPVGHYLELRTYKRNRSLYIVKKGEDDFLIIEDGYVKERFCVGHDKLKKSLATLLRKEFPRSHKVRLYVMGMFKEEAKNTMRKTI